VCDEAAAGLAYAGIVISIRTLRYVALAEATTFLVLLVATYIKYANDSPGGVKVMGPVHGMLFIAYVVITLGVRGAARWSNRTTAGILLGAVVPFGGFAVDRWLAKNPV
jgi:integral membrane protein